MTLTVATMLWDANDKSREFSRVYDESWVEKLYGGFSCNLTRPFRFVCFTDQPRKFAAPIEQEQIISHNPDYGCFIEPFRLDVPMILVGLDTIIVRNIDRLADYCFQGDKVALPLDPYAMPLVCNAIALVPSGQRHIFDHWNGENDMEWLRQQPCELIDRLFPGYVSSYKAEVKKWGLAETRIVYFHGHEKPHELADVSWVREHWRPAEAYAAAA